MVSYLQVTSAQNAALDHERTVSRLRGQQLAACVALVKSLGGGWGPAAVAMSESEPPKAK